MPTWEGRNYEASTSISGNPRRASRSPGTRRRCPHRGKTPAGTAGTSRPHPPPNSHHKDRTFPSPPAPQDAHFLPRQQGGSRSGRVFQVPGLEIPDAQKLQLTAATKFHLWPSPGILAARPNYPPGFAGFGPRGEPPVEEAAAGQEEGSRRA